MGYGMWCCIVVMCYVVVHGVRCVLVMCGVVCTGVCCTSGDGTMVCCGYVMYGLVVVGMVMCYGGMVVVWYGVVVIVCGGCMAFRVMVVVVGSSDRV